MLQFTTIKNDFRGFDRIGVYMKSAMSRFSYKCHKIFKSIVISNIVQIKLIL